jgi:Sec-independent protein secretion pathway component TatC
VLPLVLLVTVKAVEQRRAGTLVVMAALMLGFYRAPCDLLFPNVWTIAAIGLFVLGVWENRLFRSSSEEQQGVRGWR